MATPLPGADTLDQLSRALASKLLPEDDHVMAEKLRKRLAVPVRVSIMGLPGSGKSRVMELLVGQKLVPEGVELPVLRLVHSEDNITRVTLANGATEELPGLDAAAAAERMPAMVEMRADLPALKRITPMEVSIGRLRRDQERAVTWASNRSDVAIWCTGDFTAAEQAAWNLMPDLLKDQGILLRTRIDTVGSRATTMDRLQRLGGREFDQVLAIDTLSALAAREGDTLDREAFRESGGKTLIATVLKMVERFRQAYIDQADLLLAHHPEAANAPLPEPEPEPEDAAPEAEAQADTAEDAAPEKAAAETDADPSEADTPADTPDIPPVLFPEAEPAPSPATRAAFEAAVARLAAAGAELIASDAPLDNDAIMARSVREVTWLGEHLEEAEGDDALLGQARDAATDATDMVQLMQIEHAPADEAVALMIQLKRNLQRGLAIH